MEYGITREVDTSDFIDFYFGECILLFNDVRSAGNLREKLGYLHMPQGWTPQPNKKTAAALRKEFLKGQEDLGYTSRRYLFGTAPKDDGL